MAAQDNQELQDQSVETTAGEPWVKPEIVSFEPAKAAEGISFKPNDGLSNLT